MGLCCSVALLPTSRSRKVVSLALWSPRLGNWSRRDSRKSCNKGRFVIRYPHHGFVWSYLAMQREMPRRLLTYASAGSLGRKRSYLSVLNSGRVVRKVQLSRMDIPGTPLLSPLTIHAASPRLVLHVDCPDAPGRVRRARVVSSKAVDVEASPGRRDAFGRGITAQPVNWCLPSGGDGGRSGAHRHGNASPSADELAFAHLQRKTSEKARIGPRDLRPPFERRHRERATVHQHPDRRPERRLLPARRRAVADLCESDAERQSHRAGDQRRRPRT